jgi:hypothetical protein
LTPTRRHGGSSRSLPRSTSPARDGELEFFAPQPTLLLAPPDGLEPPAATQRAGLVPRGRLSQAPYPPASIVVWSENRPVPTS